MLFFLLIDNLIMVYSFVKLLIFKPKHSMFIIDFENLISNILLIVLNLIPNVKVKLFVKANLNFKLEINERCLN